MYACNKFNQMNARNEDNFDFSEYETTKIGFQKDIFFLSQFLFEVLEIRIQDR